MHSKLQLLNCRRYVEIDADGRTVVTVWRPDGHLDGHGNGDIRVIQLWNSDWY